MLARGQVGFDDVGDEVVGHGGFEPAAARTSARSMRASDPLAAEDREDIEQAEADRLAGHGDAHGVDDRAEAEAAGRDEALERSFQ